MANANRSARKCRPLPTTLPPYIVARDRFALGAGLTIEREWGGYRDTDLITRYVGPRQRVIASPFIADKEGIRIPLSERHCVKRGVWNPPSPAGHLSGAYRRGDSCIYVKFEDPLPMECGRMENGTEFYVYPDSWRQSSERGEEIYIGREKALVADGVMTDDQLLDADSSYAGNQEAAGDRTYTVWETERLSDGRIKHTKHVARSRELEAARKQNLPRYAGEDDFREHVTFLVDLALRAASRRASEPQAGPTHYFWEEATLTEFEEMGRRLLALASQAPVLNRPNTEPRRLSLVVSNPA